MCINDEEGRIAKSTYLFWNQGRWWVCYLLSQTEIILRCQIKDKKDARELARDYTTSKIVTGLLMFASLTQSVILLFVGVTSHSIPDKAGVLEVCEDDLELVGFVASSKHNNDPLYFIFHADWLTYQHLEFPATCKYDYLHTICRSSLIDFNHKAVASLTAGSQSFFAAPLLPHNAVDDDLSLLSRLCIYGCSQH